MILKTPVCPTMTTRPKALTYHDITEFAQWLVNSTWSLRFIASSKLAHS